MNEKFQYSAINLAPLDQLMEKKKDEKEREREQGEGKKEREWRGTNGGNENKKRERKEKGNKTGGEKKVVCSCSWYLVVHEEAPQKRPFRQV